jgi:hypothetical protein
VLGGTEDCVLPVYFQVGFVDLVNGCRRNSLSYVTFVHSLYK